MLTQLRGSVVPRTHRSFRLVSRDDYRAALFSRRYGRYAGRLYKLPIIIRPSGFRARRFGRVSNVDIARAQIHITMRRAALAE